MSSHRMKYHPLIPVAIGVALAAGVLGALWFSHSQPVPFPTTTTTTRPAPTTSAPGTTTTATSPVTVAATTTTSTTIPPVEVTTTTVAAPGTTLGTPAPTTVVPGAPSCATIWQPGATTATGDCTQPDGTLYTPRLLPCTDGTTLVLGAPSGQAYAGKVGGTLAAVSDDQAIEAAGQCRPSNEGGA